MRTDVTVMMASHGSRDGVGAGLASVAALRRRLPTRIGAGPGAREGRCGSCAGRGAERGDRPSAVRSRGGFHGSAAGSSSVVRPGVSADRSCDDGAVGPGVTLSLCGDVMLVRGLDQVMSSSVDPRLHEPSVPSCAGPPSTPASGRRGWRFTPTVCGGSGWRRRRGWRPPGSGRPWTGRAAPWAPGCGRRTRARWWWAQDPREVQGTPHSRPITGRTGRLSSARGRISREGSNW